MNGVPLERVTELLDLGTNVDSALSWSPQQTKSMLYCALARPILEYCSPLWSGTNFSNVRLVERVQRAMTKYICNFSADSYKERLLNLKCYLYQ